MFNVVEKNKISEELAEFIVEKIVLENKGEYIVEFNNCDYRLIVDNCVNKIYVYRASRSNILIFGTNELRIGTINNNLEIYELFGFIDNETYELTRYLETIRLSEKLQEELKNNNTKKKVSKI